MWLTYHKLCRDARAVRGHLLEKCVSGTDFVGDLGRAHHFQELRLGRCQMVSNPVKGRVSSMDKKATEELVVNMKSCPAAKLLWSWSAGCVLSTCVYEPDYPFPHNIKLSGVPEPIRTEGSYANRSTPGFRLGLVAIVIAGTLG